MTRTARVTVDGNGASVYCLHIDGKYMTWEAVSNCVRNHNLPKDIVANSMSRSSQIYHSLRAAKAAKTRMGSELREYIQIMRYAAKEEVPY